MTTTQLEFGEWWNDLLRRSGSREEPPETIERLNRFVLEQSPSKRHAFVAELTEFGCGGADSSHFALGALETLADHDSRRRVADVLQTFPEVHPPHPLADFRSALLRVLARGPADGTLRPVDAFCEGHIGPAFTSVVWALWPAHRERFARSHARYFVEVPHAEWSGTAVIQSFVATPEALAALREVMVPASAATWQIVRDEALRESSGSWVQPWQSTAIQRICSSAA